MRSFVAIVLLASVALATIDSISAEKLVTFGAREYGDQLLQQKTIKKYKFPFVTRDENVIVEGNGAAKITYIEVVDLENAGHTKRPKIMSGGIGYTYASIKLESEKGHGLHHLVKVFGK